MTEDQSGTGRTAGIPTDWLDSGLLAAVERHANARHRRSLVSEALADAERDIRASSAAFAAAPDGETLESLVAALPRVQALREILAGLPIAATTTWSEASTAAQAALGALISAEIRIGTLETLSYDTEKAQWQASGKRGAQPFPTDRDRRVGANADAVLATVNRWRADVAMLRDVAQAATSDPLDWLAAAATIVANADSVSDAVQAQNERIAAANAHRRREMAGVA